MNRAKDEQEFYEDLPRETRDTLEKILKTAEENLPAGFEMRYGEGMISYVVPLSLYEKGYHVKKGEPLPFISLVAQKGHIALYHMGLYGDKEATLCLRKNTRKRCQRSSIWEKAVSA